MNPQESLDLDLDPQESQEPDLTLQTQESEDLDFSLDDIIKEFSDPELDSILKEFGEEPLISAPAAEPEPEVAPLSQATAVFQPVEAAPEGMPELEAEPEPQPEPVAPSPLAEPFSDEWEPEYELPVGEYPHPIQFPPSKNRQAMLRKKLVAGPEKRYHALMSQGLGKLQFAIFAHLILLLLSGAITAVYLLGIVPESDRKSVV